VRAFVLAVVLAQQEGAVAAGEVRAGAAGELRAGGVLDDQEPVGGH
jgi:hypothetical protein